ncbi:DUF4252 domain-containing protein [Croceiramulus getboli]|nr:DUF4252 domain-containing protein [Flavobacteriaceae bacterium YJPT1-3]
MKKVIIIALAALLSQVSLAQDRFDQFEDMREVRAFVMNQKMFKLLGKVDLDSSDPEMQAYINLVENMENIKIFETKDAGVGAKMQSEMSSYITSSKLEELMRAKDDGKNVKFYYKPGKNEDFVREFVMFMTGDIEGANRTVIFKLTGDIDLKQISKLAKDLDFAGSKELENVKKTK